MYQNLCVRGPRREYERRWECHDDTLGQESQTTASEAGACFRK